MRSLVGKFHSHITLVDGAQAQLARSQVAGKITTIDLWQGEKHRTDTMLTHHYVTGRHGLTSHEDILKRLLTNVRYLTSQGIGVARTKLEFEYLDRLSPVGQTANINRIASYVETHVETKTALGALTGARSENSRTTTGFWTTRFYREQTDDMVGDMERYVNDLDRSAIAELKVEAAVYDDNPAHDAWWV